MPVKRILLLALTAAAMTAAPAGAHAAVPCRDKIYNEWYSTGKISTTYPISCYHDALQHIPSDAQVYSNLGSDIKAALQAALARRNDPAAGGPASVGHGLTTSKSTTGETKAAITTKTDGPSASGPLEPTGSSSGGIPIPILVLGAIAILLAGAGAVGTGVRRYRRRSAS